MRHPFLAKAIVNKPFEIKAKEGDTSATIYIYDQIGYDFWTGEGVTLKSFSDALDKLPKSIKNIDLRVNSPGGDVFDGYGIYNRLKQHSAKVTAYIDGMCASIASIIVLAADEVIMGVGAQYMIHKPWTFAGGNSDDFQKVIDLLLKLEDQMKGVYMRKVKGKLSLEELEAMLTTETWMTSEEAVEMGFADKTMEKSLAIAASAMDKMWINRPPRAYHSKENETRARALALAKEIEDTLKK